MALRYLSLDTRSLGLGRIALGLLLLADLLRRVPDLAVWYSNSGLIPNHTVLWRPEAEHQFSFFFAASHPGEAAVLFVFCGAVFTALLVGYRTRLAHALALACVVSLHARAIMLENGGDVVLTLFTAWTLFLPMGARFSVDAVIASLKSTPDTTAAELNVPLARPATRAVSLAAFAIIAQLVVIYAFNAAHKDGVTWRSGTAVHYVLHQDRIVTHLGLWVRSHLTPGASQVLTWTTLAIESALPFLIINPFGWRLTRRLAIGLGWALHLGFAAFLNLGLFSANMMGLWLLLLTEDDWRWLQRWFAPSPRRARTVYFDADCGVCLLCVRVLRRLDTGERLRFVGNDDPAVPADLDRALLDRTMVVEDPRTGARHTRARAFATIFRALPFGWLATPLLVPPLSWVAGRAYDAFAGRRSQVSQWLGLAACGVPQTRTPDAPVAPPRHATGQARELAVALLLLCCGGDLLRANRAVPEALRPRQPALARWVVQYPRLFQGWGMFAPEAPTEDHHVVVDARTRDGRHVDPMNQLASRVAEVPLAAVPDRLGHDEFWCDYINRIAYAPTYFQALREWIYAYPKRTGNPQDEVVSFTVSLITDQSPPPGETEPRNVRVTTVMTGENGK